MIQQCRLENFGRVGREAKAFEELGFGSPHGMLPGEQIADDFTPFDDRLWEIRQL